MKGRLMRMEVKDEHGEVVQSSLVFEPPVDMLRWGGHAMLANWRGLDARAAHVAIVSRRLGHLTDQELLERIAGIVLYDCARAVIAEALDAQNRVEERTRARLARVQAVQVAPRVVAVGDPSGTAMQALARSVGARHG